MLLAVAVAAAVLLPFALSPSRLIEARDVSSGETLGCGESITVRFTHSMFGGDVAESYEASSTGVKRIRLVTERAAAAEYYAWTEEVVRVEDGFEVRVAPHAFDEIVILVDDVGAHRLIMGGDGRVLDLRDLVGDGGRVRLRSQLLTPIERLFGPC
jgi:hypothetical protein